MTMSGAAILEAHRRRFVGVTGVRQVMLEVHTSGADQIGYSVLHAWKANAAECRSLLCLTSPVLMAGTRVLIIESPGGAGMEIWLRLRTAREAIRVAATHAGDFVLGTDFTYEDLRFWLPVDDLDIIHAIPPSATNPDVCRLRVTRKSRPRDGVMELDLDAKNFYAKRIAWKPRDGHIAEKILDMRGYEVIEGVWGPTCVSVARPAAGYVSTMRLQSVVYNLELADGLFLPAGLGEVDIPALQRALP